MIVFPILIGIGGISLGSVSGEPQMGQEIVLAIDLWDLTDQSLSIIRVGSWF